MLIRHMFAVFMVLAALMVAPAGAEVLPDVDELKSKIGLDPTTVRVYEPHLSVGQRYVALEYVGYPAEVVFSAVLGHDWRDKAGSIEFRALDGYVSHIATSKFRPGKAFLVFSRQDQSAFSVNNIAQNEENVPLGPYYLVWDNISDAKIRSEGAAIWPYQVHEIRLFSGSDAALLPGGLEARYYEGADLAKTHCLNCHKINGYGGQKFEGNLAEIVKGFEKPDFVFWVLNPRSIRKETSMPALSDHLPESERQRVAGILYDYMQHIPVFESPAPLAPSKE